MAQVGVLEEVIRGGGGKVVGDGEVVGARGGLAVTRLGGSLGMTLLLLRGGLVVCRDHLST